MVWFWDRSDLRSSHQSRPRDDVGTQVAVDMFSSYSFITAHLS